MPPPAACIPSLLASVTQCQKDLHAAGKHMANAPMSKTMSPCIAISLRSKLWCSQHCRARYSCQTRPVHCRPSALVRVAPPLQGMGRAQLEVFAGNRVYLGGVFSPNQITRQPITLLHGVADVKGGAQEVASGIYKVV